MRRIVILILTLGLLTAGVNAHVLSTACGNDVTGSLGVIPRATWLAKHQPSFSTQATADLRVLRLAVETDTKFFEENGGTVELASAYMHKLVKATSRVFEREQGVQLQIVWTKIWTSQEPDPYQCGGDGVKLGAPALAYWKDNSTVDRDAVLVLTSGGGGGIGYQFTADDGGGLSSLCTSLAVATASPFAKTVLPSANFEYSVYIIAHELGHVLGAVHSHNCYWAPALDTCTVRNDPNFASGDACLVAPAKPKPNAGSIMSYCGGVNNANGWGYTLRMTFLEKINTYMREQLASLACSLAPRQPAIVLIKPHHNGESVDGSVVISWKKSDVATVVVEWQKQGEASWQFINLVANSEPDSVQFTPPPTNCGYNFVVRVRSYLDSTLADTSDMLLTSPASTSTQCLRAQLAIMGGQFVTDGCIVPEKGYGGSPATDRYMMAQGAWAMNNDAPITYTNVLGPETEGTYVMWFLADRITGVQHLIGTNWEQTAIASLFVWEGTLGSAVWSTGNNTPIQAWGPSVTRNVWHQAALTFDKTKQSLYFDGNLITTQPLTAPVNATKATVYVGRRGAISEAYYGSVDDVRIYSCALSADSIKSLYNAEKAEPGYVSEGSSTNADLPLVIEHNASVLTVRSTVGEQIVSVQLFDSIARELLGGTSAILNTSGLPSGQYTVVIQTPAGYVAKQILLTQ